MAPWKQWFVAPQAASFCVTVDGVAQWLCELDGRWQRKALLQLRNAGCVC